jgi:hypothetical protein
MQPHSQATQHAACSAARAGDDADAECGASGRHRKPHNAWTSINFVLPAILLASDAVFGMAAGMTVKFFPIFFKVHPGRLCTQQGK